MHYTTMRNGLSAVLVTLLMGGTGFGAASSTSLGLHLHPCIQGKSKVPAQCGTFGVYEDRASHSGRVIELNVVILQAKNPTNRAIYWNPGGPGAASVPAAPFLADGVALKEIAALRDRYNIIFVDGRGMGGSHSLNCDLFARSHPDPYFLQLWPSAALTACRAKVARDADLNAYTTINAVDDLDDLRAALGYPKLVLDGDSYGTYTSFVYMRRHPNRVESAVLDGVAPPHLLHVPLEDPKGAQETMSSLIDECKRDALCHRNFPRFAEDFDGLMRRLDRDPVSLGGLKLSKEVFADRLRQTMYIPAAAAYVPYIIEQEARGNYQPLATMVSVTTFGMAQVLEMTTNLNYTCAEQIPFITASAVARESSGTFMGDTRIVAQQQACKIWNVRPLPATADELVRSDAPVLMISGSNDPTSPDEYARQELPLLPNAKWVVVRAAGHITETKCTDDLKIAFVRAQSAKGLDVASCYEAFKLPPFATSMRGFDQVDI